MRLLRWIVVFLFALFPLTTLVHRNDLGRWDVNRNAMAAPDEFSYLLLADSLLHGDGISTAKTIGRDTFYPPGYPLLLAGWSRIVGLTVFHAHVLNAILVCIATLVVYAFTQRLLRLLGEGVHPQFQMRDEENGWLAVLIAGLFATNWHVLEGALFVFSEPAFMLVTFAWLALGLRWREWHRHLLQTFVLTLLAIAAWAIRGAGMVCIAAMLGSLLLQLFNGRELPLGRRMMRTLQPVLLILLLAITYQITITRISPEKSLASVNSSDNSYGLQLLRGITKNDTLHDFPSIAARVVTLAFSHLDDYAGSFTPWFRESPAYLFLNLIGKTFGLLGLFGWLYRFLRGNSPTRFLEVYILFYIALYLLWPFNMTRFWAPLLPIMLAYAVDALRQLSQCRRVKVLNPRTAAPILLLLLLALSTQEMWLQLGNYERRLNYVSDALADAARAVVRHSPNPADTIFAVGGTSEHFVFAWYLPRPYLPRSPEPRLPATGGRETVEAMLIRSLREVEASPPKRLFVTSYFTEPDYPDVFRELQRREPALMAHFAIRRIFQKEIITTVWEFMPRPTPASFP
jgi:hypothetical protein